MFIDEQLRLRVTFQVLLLTNASAISIVFLFIFTFFKFATGEHKIPISLIGKPKKPACVMNRKWPTIYMQQKRAWMDQSVCWKWFEEVFVPEVTKKLETQFCF